MEQFKARSGHTEYEGHLQAENKVRCVVDTNFGCNFFCLLHLGKRLKPVFLHFWQDQLSRSLCHFVTSGCVNLMKDGRVTDFLEGNRVTSLKGSDWMGAD